MPFNCKITKLGDFRKGTALPNGDCFFDSILQGLKQLFPTENFSVKSLRKICSRYNYNQDTKLKTAILLDASEGGYLPNSIDIQKIFKNYLYRISLTSDEAQALGLCIVWGRPDIEGVVICRTLGIKLHIRELHYLETEVWLDQIVDENGSKSMPINYDDLRTVHIENSGNLHFIPLLRDLNTNEDQRPPRDQPENDQLYFSIDLTSYCFFQFTAQELKGLFPNENITPQTIKSKYYNFVTTNANTVFNKNNSLTLKEFIVKNTNGNDCSEEHLNNYLKLNFCGRPEIEGRIIAEIYNVQFHLRELFLIPHQGELICIWSEEIIDKISCDVIENNLTVGNDLSELDVNSLSFPINVVSHKILSAYNSSVKTFSSGKDITYNRTIDKKYFVYVLSKLSLKFKIISLHDALCNIISSSNLSVLNLFINQIETCRSVDLDFVLSKACSEIGLKTSLDDNKRNTRFLG